MVGAGEHLLTPTRRAGLLVSVRDAREAAAAVAGGADVIDVKEPARGPLGAADARQVEQVLRRVAGRKPVTAAAGELREVASEGLSGYAGCQLVKLGVAGLGSDSGWERRARGLAGGSLAGRLVLAAYADHAAADAPTPERVLAIAAEISCRWALIDTFDKTGPILTQTLDRTRLAEAASFCHRRGMRLALAGRLGAAAAGDVAEWGADLVGVRGAVCGGDRLAGVDEQAVRRLATRLHGVNAAAVSSPE